MMMFISFFFSGALIGSGSQVLFSKNPIYPKEIAAILILVGIVLLIIISIYL